MMMALFSDIYRHGGIIAMVSAILLTPSWAQNQVPAPSAPQMTPAPPVTVAVNADYRLRPNDVVSVIVFQEPELGCTERISADGTISVPLAGRVRIGGSTPVGAASAVEAALEDGYLVNAQVSLAVTEATKQYFTILGQVATPGSIALPSVGKVDLLQAVGMAGGFTRLASPSKITVKRVVGGMEKVLKVDAQELANGKSQGGFEVLPGDVITVKERIF